MSEQERAEPVRNFLTLVEADVHWAREHERPLASYYEAYGLIMEGICTYFDEVRTPRPDFEAEPRALRALVEIASASMRAAEDMGLLWDGNAREPYETHSTAAERKEHAP